MGYPLMMDLSKKKISIVGGGEVACRKALSLKDYCNFITVISPEILEELKFANCIYKKYSKELIKDSDFVLACTNDIDVNLQIKKDCEELKIMYLLASPSKESEVIFPATLKLGDITISISTDGGYPALSKRIKEDLKERYKKYDEEFITELKNFRKLVIENDLDRGLLTRALDMDIEELKEYIGKFK